MFHRFNLETIAALYFATLACSALGATPPSMGHQEKSGDWVSLFNGKDLSGWHLVLAGDNKGIDPENIFQVHDGVIHVYRGVPQGSPVPYGYIATNESYSHYHLKLEYRWMGARFAPRIDRPRDSGLLYHASAVRKVWPRSVECQIQEGDVGDCFTVRGTQVQTTVDPAKLKSGIHRYLPVEKGGVRAIWGGPGISRIIKGSTHEIEGWNTVEMIVRGDEEAIHLVNGHEVFQANHLKQLDADGQTWIPLKSGHLLLQAEFAELQYRNIQIRPLDSGPFKVAKASDSAAEGVYRLLSGEAKLNGPGVRFNDQAKTLEQWSTKTDVANWRIKDVKPGNYDVAVTWSVAEADAPQGYNIQINHRATIRAFTVSTGGQFKREIVGRILLSSGTQTVTFFPTSNVTHGDLCKLKQIELVPVTNISKTAPQEPVELHVPQGFQVEQVAGPPLTSHPMLACFDDRGRLFVTESTGVNADASILEKALPHEVRVLEDTDGDGKFDKSTVFADKMTIPQGICWHEGSIYCSSPPNFWRLTDTDGDNIADKREILATGFPFRGMSDDMHGGTLGRDGRLYFASGRMGQKLHRPNGPVIYQGFNPVIVRCQPDGSEFEVYSGAMGNAVGVDFLDNGDCFGSGTFGVNEPGKRDVLDHFIEGAAYPVLGQPLVNHKLTGPPLPNLAQFGASASSDLMVYRDRGFGDEFEGNLMSALFNLHKVERHVLEPDGATYRCRNEEFLTSPNADFHPTDVLEDADGSVLVVDTGAWFLIGCPTSVIAKPQISGGVYRIRASDAKRIEDPRGLAIAWDSLGPEALIKLLDDPRFAVRDRAMVELAAKGELSVAALKKAIRESTSPRLRMNAVWTLSRIASPHAAEAARLALGDSDAGVRQVAATTAGLFRDQEALPRLLEIVRQDDSTPVRREAAGALGRIGKTDAVPGLLASLTGVTDRFLDHAIIFALIRLDDRGKTVAGLSDPSPEVRRGALIALDQMDHGNLTQDDVSLALESNDARVQQAALEIISRHSGWAQQIIKLSQQWLKDPEFPEDRRLALRGVLLALSEEKAVQHLIAGALSDREAPRWTKLLLLELMGQSELNELPAKWREPLLGSLQSSDLETAQAAVSAIAAINRSLGSESVLGQPELLQLARDEQRPSDLRVAAAAAALRTEGEIDKREFELLIKSCGSDVKPVTRLMAANAIGSGKLSGEQRERVVEMIAAAGPLELPSLIRPLENTDLSALGGKLVQSLEKSPGLSALAGDRLTKLIEKLPTDVRSKADALLERTQGDLQGQRQRLGELQETLTGGDPERGQKLFFGNKATCSACHRIGDEGANIGPNLTGIGDIRTRRDLLEAIVFPSASFARNYEPYTVQTISGKVHTGIIARTNSDAIFLINAARETQRIPRSEIEEDGLLPATVSIMPQGLDRILRPDELQDLVAFLSAQRGQKAVGGPTR